MTKNIKGQFVLIISIWVLSACSNNSPFTEEFFEETSYSTDQFSYQEDRIEVGTVYNFEISNSDRSYIKKVSLYTADTNKIEAFKIYPGSSSTVLVSAEIDWELFSIKTIEQIEIAEDLSRKSTIEMHWLDDPGNSYLMNNEDEIPVGHFPASNHGFDFSDLNFVFRHLVDPKSDIEVGILAPVQKMFSFDFAYTGKMLITFEGEDTYNDNECYRYSLSGKGIGEREGYILVNKDLGHFEYMELDANYHPEMDYFRYELLDVVTMSPEEWETFVSDETKNYFSTKLL
jgi:hypothetical protein